MMGRKVFYKKSILVAMVCSFLCTFFLVRMKQDVLAYANERVSIKVDDMRFLSSLDEHKVYEDTLYLDDVYKLQIYATATNVHPLATDETFSIAFSNYEQLQFSFQPNEVLDVLNVDGQIAGSFSLKQLGEQLFIDGILFEPIANDEKLVFNIPYEMQLDANVQDKATITFGFDQYSKTYAIDSKDVDPFVSNPTDTTTQISEVFVSYDINGQAPPAESATPGSVIEYKIVATSFRDGIVRLRFKDEMPLLDNTTGFGELLEDPYSSLSLGDDTIRIRIYTPGVSGYQEKLASFKDLQNGDISLTMSKYVSIEISYTLYMRNLDDIAVDGEFYGDYNREMNSSVLVEELNGTSVIDAYVATNGIEIQMPVPVSKLVISDHNQNGIGEPNEFITFCLQSENIGEIDMERQKVEMYFVENLKYFVDPNLVAVDVYYDNQKVERSYTLDDLINGRFNEHLNANQKFEAKFTLQLKNEAELTALGVSSTSVLRSAGTVGNSFVYTQLALGGQLSIDGRVEKLSFVSNNDGIIRPGDYMQYTIDVKNTSLQTLNNVPFRMYFQDNREYIDFTATTQYSGYLNIKSNLNGTTQKNIASLWNESNPLLLNMQPGEKITIQFVLVTHEIVTDYGYNLDKLKNVMHNKFDATFTVQSNATYQTFVSIPMDKPNLKVDLIIVDPNNNKVLEPDETFTFHFIVQNNDAARKRVPIIAYLEDLRPYANSFVLNQIMIYEYTPSEIKENGFYRIRELISGIDAFYLESNYKMHITFSIRFLDNKALIDGLNLDVIVEANGIRKNEEVLTYVPIPVTGFDNRQNYLLWLIICPISIGVSYGTYKYRKWRKG
ncbi:putative repeat protein (TIGR01451 family) [Breznakia blatticola]|uniref:Putative repeat protein (TIGR01451 family) n=1 Tax=Breznakia blatticola TaxID=1754012 RepID=A0A4R8AA51_9FIRM|nr:hypothetical protein [Breznakia blatticola]TDW25280.1 putative repeat protein (TIGR01451 family) [Breznakia blatticola]